MPAIGVTYNFTDQTTVPEAGIEAGVGRVSVNAGYLLREGDLNLDCGLRLRLERIVLGYAFIPGNYLDAAHRLNIEYRFSD
jgi:hypothetical protein